MSNFEHIMIAATVFVDGVGKIGTCEKIMLPKVKKHTEDFRSGGMLAGRKVALGFDPFEFEFDLHSYDPQVIAQIAIFSKKQVPISFRGAFDGDKTKNAAILVCAGEFMEIDAGNWDAGKKAVLKAKGALTALQLTYGGTELYNIDVTTDTYVFSGVDEYAWARTALGY